MLLHFDTLRICLHDVGSIFLVPSDPFYRYFRTGGSIYWSPDRFREGGESHVTPAGGWFHVSVPCWKEVGKHCH